MADVGGYMGLLLGMSCYAIYQSIETFLRGMCSRKSESSKDKIKTETWGFENFKYCKKELEGTNPLLVPSTVL